jgi:hypothetical protein
MQRWRLLSLLMLPLLAFRANADHQNKATGSPNQAAQKQPPSDITMPLLSAPLRLADFPNMEPLPSLRSSLTHVTGFIQQAPRDGQRATEETEVWMGRTHSTVYFVFICRDRHPSLIRGHLARRENILKDDWVSVLLDPFQDRRKGVMFAVNPAGVQADAAWTENTDPDYSYDQVWDSEARVTPNGWIALIAIPFRSLRFHAANSDWGIVFTRNFPRNSEMDYWPRVSAEVSGTLTQEATLHGIEGVTGSHNFQLNPYVLAQSERTLLTNDPLNPYFSVRHFEGTAGGEVKLILKDSIVIDGTVNPDFSDVESDQPQFTVNQRYPVYFPELRPFFLENANYFSTPINLLYTRNIVHPEYGVRLTGKVGRHNLGVLAIDDRQPGEAVPILDPLYGHRARIGVARYSRDFGEGSSAGLIYTDEEFGGGWNRIGGVDLTFKFNKHWTGFAQMVESSTQGFTDSGNPPSYSAGPASYVEFTRSGHSLNLDTVTSDFSTGFQTQLGFIQSSNQRANHTHFNYQWYPKKGALQSWGLEANENIAFDHQNNRVYRYLTFDPFFLLARNTVIAPIGGQNSDTLGPQNGYLLEQNQNFTENFGGIVFRSAPWNQLNFNIVAIRGGNVNYNPVSGAAPSLMDQQFVQARWAYQPLKQLSTDNTYLLDRDHAVSNGAFVYESQKFRTKVNYQFTQSISARVIVEYDSTLANPKQTSLQRTKQIGTQALLTWLPHPGTAIYLGYNDDLQNLDKSLCNREPNGQCDPNNTVPPRAPYYINDGRQFFLKASYLIRF